MKFIGDKMKTEYIIGLIGCIIGLFVGISFLPSIISGMFSDPTIYGSSMMIYKNQIFFVLLGTFIVFSLVSIIAIYRSNNNMLLVASIVMLSMGFSIYQLIHFAFNIFLLAGIVVLASSLLVHYRENK